MRSKDRKRRWITRPDRIPGSATPGLVERCRKPLGGRTGSGLRMFGVLADRIGRQVQVFDLPQLGVPHGVAIVVEREIVGARKRQLRDG
jgi:hypothetical protein